MKESWISKRRAVVPQRLLPKSLLLINYLLTVAISKLLEIIGRPAYILACSIATALHSDINQTASSGGHLSLWENLCMHASVCLLHAGQDSPATWLNRVSSKINSCRTNMSQRSSKGYVYYYHTWHVQISFNGWDLTAHIWVNKSYINPLSQSGRWKRKASLKKRALIWDQKDNVWWLQWPAARLMILLLQTTK